MKSTMFAALVAAMLMMFGSFAMAQTSAQKPAAATKMGSSTTSTKGTMKHKKHRKHKKHHKSAAKSATTTSSSSK
jgi:hypothetical protein